MTNLTLAFLAMAPPGDGSSQSPWISLFPFVLIFLIFYFLLIAPARRKQKKHAEMIGNLKNGDRIITQGGLYGTVVGVTENVIQVRIADKVKIDVAKHAIAGLQAPPGE
jgi:preprotein translocase subunit YajC